MVRTRSATSHSIATSPFQRRLRSATKKPEACTSTTSTINSKPTTKSPIPPKKVIRNSKSAKKTDTPKSTPTNPPKPFNIRHVAERYLVEAEEYVDKAERFEKEAHRSMDEADCYSKRGEDFVEKALNDPGPNAIKLYESARDTYNSARRCLEESVRCNDAATRNYRTARDYYEAYARCCPSCPTTSPTHSSSSSSSSASSSSEDLGLD